MNECMMDRLIDGQVRRQVNKQGNDDGVDMDRLPGRSLMICVTIFRLYHPMKQ